MAEYTANAVQPVAVNQNVLFYETPVPPQSCDISHREGSGIITLKGGSCCQSKRYKATFSGNMAIPTGGTPGQISLALALNGEPIDATRMIFTPTVAERYGNVSSSIYINITNGCCMQLSVENVSAIPIEVQNANIIIERVL